MRILLLEDDEKMAALLRKGLEGERHPVALARDGSEGIGIFFGYYPAGQAARLDPIEALRFE